MNSKPTTGAATRAGLCDDMTDMINRRSQELIQLGYAPDLAKFDCLMTMKIIVDQLHGEFDIGHARQEWYRELFKGGSGKK